MLGNARPAASLLGASAAVLCAACSSDPEVVAVERDGTEYLPPGSESCQPGDYKGRFFTRELEEGEVGLDLSGTIDFSIVKSEGGGDVFEFRPNTTLEGEDTGTARFTAEVVTGRCLAGAYETQLVNGLYSGLNPDGSLSGLNIPFEGTIKGRYSRAESTFSGLWDTVIPCLDGSGKKCPAASGAWVAILGTP